MSHPPRFTDLSRRPAAPPAAEHPIERRRPTTWRRAVHAPATVATAAARRLALHPFGGLTRCSLLAARGEHGQATAEYGLVILAAGSIALGVIAWAGGTGTFTDMFEAVVDKLSESL